MKRRVAMRLMPALLVAIAATSIGQFAFADTADVKTQTIVEVKKKGAHCEQDPNCFNRYHPAIKPVARAKPAIKVTRPNQTTPRSAVGTPPTDPNRLV